MLGKNNHAQELILYPEFHSLINSNNSLRNKNMMKKDLNEIHQNELEEKKQLEYQSLPASTIVSTEQHNTEENLVEMEASTFPEFLKEEVDSNDDVRPRCHSFQSYYRHSFSSFSTSTTTTVTAVPTPTIRPYSFCSSNSDVKNRYNSNSLSSRNSLLPFTNNYNLTKQSIKGIISQTILNHSQSPKMLFSPLKDVHSSTSKTSSMISFPMNYLSSQSQLVPHKNEEERQNEKDNHSPLTKNEENLEERNISFVNSHRPSSSMINEIGLASKDEIDTVSNDTLTISNKMSKEEFNPQNHSNNTCINNVSEGTIHNSSLYHDSFHSIPLSSPDEDDDGQHKYSFQYTFQYYLLQIFDKLLLRNEQIKRFCVYQSERNDKSLSNPLFLEFFLQVLLDAFSRKILNTPESYRKIDGPWITILFIYFNRSLLQKQMRLPTFLPFKSKSYKERNQYQTTIYLGRGVSPINKFKNLFKGELHSFHLRNHIKCHQINNNIDHEHQRVSEYEKQLWLGVKTLSRIQHHICKRHQRPHSWIYKYNDNKNTKRKSLIISRVSNQPKPLEKGGIISKDPLSPSTIPMSITSDPNSFLNYYMQYKKNKEKQVLSKGERIHIGNTVGSHEIKEKDHLHTRNVNPVVFKHKDSLKCYHSNNTKKLKAKNKENMEGLKEKKINSIEEEKGSQNILSHPSLKKEKINNYNDSSPLPKYEPLTPTMPSTTPSSSTSLSKDTTSASSSPHHYMTHRNCNVSLEAIQAMEVKYQHNRKPKTDKQILSSFYRFLVKEDRNHRQCKDNSTRKNNNYKKGKEESYAFNKDTQKQQGKSHSSYSSFFSCDSDSFYEHEYEFYNNSDHSESVKENDNDIESEISNKKDSKSINFNNQKDKHYSFVSDDEEVDDFISLNDSPKSFCGSNVSSISLTSFSGISFHEQSSDEEIEKEKKEEEGKKQEEEKEQEKEREQEEEKELNNVKKDEKDIEIKINHENDIENVNIPNLKKENKPMMNNNPLDRILNEIAIESQETTRTLNLPRTVSLTRLNEYQQHHYRQYSQPQQLQQYIGRQEKDLYKREKQFSFSPPLIPLDEGEKKFYAQSRGSGSQHFPKHQPSSQHLYPLITLQRSLSTSRYTSRDKGMHGGGIEHKSSWNSSSVFSLPLPRRSNSTRSWKKEEQKGNKKMNPIAILLRKKKKGYENDNDCDSEYSRKIPQFKKKIMSFAAPNKSRSLSSNSSSVDKNKNTDFNINNNHFNNIEAFANYSIYNNPTNSQDQKLYQPSSPSTTKEKNFKFPKMRKQTSLSSLIFRHKYHHQKPQQQQQQHQYLSSPLSLSVQPIKISPSMSQVPSNSRKRGRDRSSLNTLNNSLLPLPGFDEEEELHYMEDKLTNSPETTSTLFEEGDDPNTQRHGGLDEKDPNTTISSSVATIGTATSTISTDANGTRNKLKGKKSRPYLRVIKSSLELLKIKNRSGSSKTGSSKTGSSRDSSSTTLANDSLTEGYPSTQFYTNPPAYRYTFGEGAIAWKEQNESSSEKQPNKKKLKNSKKSNTNKNDKKFSSSRNEFKIRKISKKTSTATFDHRRFSNTYNLDFDFDFDAIDIATVINTNTTVQNVITEEDMLLGKDTSINKGLKPGIKKMTMNKEKKHSYNEYAQEPDLTTMLPLAPSESEPESESETETVLELESLEDDNREDNETNLNIQSNTTFLQPSFLVHGEGDINREEGQILSGLSALTLTPIPRSASPTPSTSSSNDSILASLEPPIMSTLSITTTQPPCFGEQQSTTPIENIHEVPITTNITKETMNNNDNINANTNTNMNINNRQQPQPQHQYQNQQHQQQQPHYQNQKQHQQQQPQYQQQQQPPHHHRQQEKKESYSDVLDLSLPSPTISFSIHNNGHRHGHNYDLHHEHPSSTIHPSHSIKTPKQKREERSTSFVSTNYSHGSIQRQNQSRRVSSSSQYSLKSNFSKKSIVSLMNLIKHRKK